MARGRPPKPRELRIAQGNPGKRRLPTPVGVGRRVAGAAPEPPSGLGAASAEVWRELAGMLTEAGMLQESDLVMLEGLVVMVTRARQARAELAERGLVVDGARGGQHANPLVRVERDSWQMALRLAGEFGLTPSSRAKLGLTIGKGRSLLQDLNERTDRALDTVPTSVTLVEDVVPDRAEVVKVGPGPPASCHRQPRPESATR